MWKEYSSDYIKNNRSSAMAIRMAAFISALFLSLLCGLFYNAWKYEVERITLEKGGWHSRISGALDSEDIAAIRNFASVREAAVNKKESQGEETVLDLWFEDRTAVLEDTPKIAALAGLSPEAVTYNHELLALYLIRDPQDPAPRLVFPLFLLITVLASVSLMIVIHSSFAVSMNARIHQFGIFSSVGATPKQIRTCLLQEAAALCAAPVLAGNVFGILASMGLMQLSNLLLADYAPGRHEAVFGCHPLVLLAALLATAVTVWISAWIPAGKISRRTPLESIRNTDGLQPKRRKKFRVLTLLFGVEGELAGNALYMQRKALRTASLSLIFSFMAFTMMQCFFSLSGISTRETYFERYQDAWDLMVTVKDTGADSFGMTEEIRNLPGVESAVVYQKAAAKRIVAEEELSEEMKSFGGFSHASENYVVRTDGGWLVNAPIVILDDAGFQAYCEAVGADAQSGGAVVYNQIRDVTNPDFRHPQYMPYIKETDGVSVLRQSGREEMTAELPVLAYTEQVPVLREEYAALDYYELVHFIPASLWAEIKEQIGGAEADTYIRVLGEGEMTSEELNALQREIDRIVSREYTAESENRIQEYEANNKMIQGMKAIFGGFCALLAAIGIGNVFSNTLGFVHQRKRELARYMSVGMTPGQMKKLFCIEALVLAVRPVLLTLPLAAVTVGAMLRASYIDPAEFLAEAPLLPTAVFLLAIWGTVALAYFLGWRNVQGICLAEVLRDDTMM